MLACFEKETTGRLWIYSAWCQHVPKAKIKFWKCYWAATLCSVICILLEAQETYSRLVCPCLKWHFDLEKRRKKWDISFHWLLLLALLWFKKKTSFRWEALQDWRSTNLIFLLFIKGPSIWIKKHFDNAHAGIFWVVLCSARTLTQWSLCVPSNTGHSMIK